MKKIISLFVIFSLLFMMSCSDDDQKNDADILKGTYILKTLTSDVPLDLNHDGVFSTDILQELDFAYNTSYKLFNVKGPFSSDNYYLFNGSVLTANFFPQYNQYNIIYISGLISGKIFKYDKNFNVLEYEADPPFVHEPDFPEDIHTATNPTITNMEVLPDMKIKITMQHRYTETPETYPDCWTNVVLTAVYEKYSDNPD